MLNKQNAGNVGRLTTNNCQINLLTIANILSDKIYLNAYVLLNINFNQNKFPILNALNVLILFHN